MPTRAGAGHVRQLAGTRMARADRHCQRRRRLQAAGHAHPAPCLRKHPDGKRQ